MRGGNPALGPLVEGFCSLTGSDFSSHSPPGLDLCNRVLVLSGFCSQRSSVLMVIL